MSPTSERRVRLTRLSHELTSKCRRPCHSRSCREKHEPYLTDSSPDGLLKGAPAILGAGLMGDRASVIFSSPEEISGFIEHAC